MSGKQKAPEDPRESMIRDQLERRGIRDLRVLEAFRRIPREEFVPRDLRKRAYEDHPLPIGADQTISQPYMTALMTQALEVAPDSKVLEIGTGSGYQTALLSLLASEVFTVERVPELLETARERLHRLNLDKNVTFVVGDGSLGLDSKAPFDRILVAAAAPAVPIPLLEQLGVHGILVIPVGDRISQVLERVRRTDEGYERESLCPCVFVPLLGTGGFED